MNEIEKTREIQAKINWARKREIKLQVIDFIVLMMEEYNITIEDLT